MKKTSYFLIIVLFSIVFLFYIIPVPWTESNKRETTGGGDFSLPSNFPHPAETITELLPYHYYQEEVMYDAVGDVQRDFSVHDHTVLSHIKDIATQTLLHPLLTASFHSGRYRWLPDGVEHDLLYKDHESHLSKRVILFQKLNNAQIVHAINVDNTKVYYPVVFSLYNPHLVYPLQDQGIPSITQQLKVSEHTGFWRDFGYGMTCVSRGDYEAAGGYLDIRVWGKEDEALFQTFLTKEHIKVIRAPDPSLFHLYHTKECVASSDPAYVSCLKSHAATEGSKMQLGLTLLKMQHGVDLEGVLSKRFYYFWLVPYLGGLLVLSLFTNLVLAVLLLLCARRTHGCKVL